MRRLSLLILSGSNDNVPRAKYSQVRSIASLEFETQMRNSPRLDNVEIPAKITRRGALVFSRGKGYDFISSRASLLCKTVP